MKYPSIFNDVIGPVMRGPSSSHCAASLRIGRICRDLMDEELTHILIEFDPNGSLATTHEGQGSDMGLFGGFLGWEAHDERLTNSANEIKGAGIEVEIQINDYGAVHPNTYKIRLTNTRESHEIVALSTGGGMIEVIEIDQYPIKMGGDYFETLVFCDSSVQSDTFQKKFLACETIHVHSGPGTIIQLQSLERIDEEIIGMIYEIEGVQRVKQIEPVLPILSRKNLEVPFITSEEMLEYNRDKEMALWELAMEYESIRGNIPKNEVFERMGDIVDIMENSIASGLKGTEFSDRILGSQSPHFLEKMKGGNLIQGDISNTIILYISAMMEVKSSMGVIVAAPTAGACGTLPGAILGVADSLGLKREDKIKAMLAAGMIGTFIAAHATFAAEVAGCQAETGAGGCMAAAGLIHLAGGSLLQALSASSFALQNSLGLICDPVANRVEAPCLGKNVMAGSNALSCANMALANYDHLIPLDEVIETMNKVGQAMDSSLRCTSLGGLSITNTSRAIEAQLKQNEEIPFFKSC